MGMETWNQGKITDYIIPYEAVTVLVQDTHNIIIARFESQKTGVAASCFVFGNNTFILKPSVDDGATIFRHTFSGRILNDPFKITARYDKNRLLGLSIYTAIQFTISAMLDEERRRAGEAVRAALLEVFSGKQARILRFTQSTQEDSEPRKEELDRS